MWLIGIWLHWHIALRAEAAVLGGHPDANRLAAARPIVAGNPIATAILDRAAALLDDDHERLLTTATAFETAGCLYQRARTLILADGRRKSIEPLAQRLGEVHNQALHHFVAPRWLAGGQAHRPACRLGRCRRRSTTTATRSGSGWRHR